VLFVVLNAYKAQKLTKMLSSKDGLTKRKKYFFGEKTVITSTEQITVRFFFPFKNMEKTRKSNCPFFFLYIKTINFIKQIGTNNCPFFFLYQKTSKKNRTVICSVEVCVFFTKLLFFPQKNIFAFSSTHLWKTTS